MHARPWVKGAALVAASALTVTTLAGTPAHAADPAPSAGTWLAGELTNGLVYNAQFAYDDFGLSADFALALADIGSQPAAVAAINGAVAANIGSYIAGDAFGDPGSTYAGATAKALVLAQTAGANPSAYGGVDLVGRLQARVSSTAPILGRIEDQSSFGDFANTIGQAFAARGLANAGSVRAADATSFLLAQQCSPGYFRLSFAADKTAATQGCVDGGGAGNVPDTDTTALAVIQLSAIKSPDARVTAAIDRALGWLASRQQVDGALVGDDADEVVNTNSTGLAAWAFAEQGRCLAAGRAANYVRGLQVPAGVTGPLATEVGAIAYDRAAYTAAQTGGITDATSDQWRRASAQAAPALASTLSPTLTDATAATTFLKAGSTQWISLKGTAAGDNLCVTGPDGTVRSLRAGAADFNTSVEVPDETGEFTYTFAFAGGERSVVLKVLDAVKIKTKALRKKVRIGKSAKVKLQGLESGEKVKVRVGTKVVDKGQANAKGIFVAKFKVTKKIAKNKKKLVVKTTGQFGQARKGRTTLRVLR